MQNVMSIDLEDWFCVYNLSRLIPYADWDKCESRIERGTMRLLELFRKHNVEATFFVLGWVAERFPDLVKEVERGGHEIASHGYSHRLLTYMTPDEFRADLLRSLEVLARTTSQSVLGFRAPSFSLTSRTLWAVDADPSPHVLAEGLTELPMGVADVLGRKVPCSGGGYFRLFPYAVTRLLMRRCNAQGRPVIFYLHPWELDPGQPRMEGLSWSTRFRHYNNLDRTEERLDRLLGDFSFTSARNLLAEQGPWPA